MESIIKHTSVITYEIIVVDNASKKEDYLTLEKGIQSLDKPFIKLHRSKINTGFGGGNMHGVQFASPSKYIAFINNDVEIEDNVLKALKYRMDKASTIGVSSPQMLDTEKDPFPTISAFPSVAKEILGRRFLEKTFPNKYPKRRAIHKKPTKADLVIGSFMFFRRKDFNAIGGFDTNLFLYYEEADVCCRLQKLGKSAYLFPELSYIHHISKSTGSNDSPKIQIEHHISLLYVIRKNNGFLSYAIVLNFLRLKFLFKSIFKASKRPVFIAYMKGLPLIMSLKQTQKITD